MHNLNIPRQHLPQNIQNHIKDNLQQVAQIPGIMSNILAIQQDCFALVEHISSLVMQHPAAIITTVTVVVVMWFNKRSATQRILHSARNVISDTINNVAPANTSVNTYNLPLHVGPRYAGNIGGMLYLVRLVICGIFRR